MSNEITPTTGGENDKKNKRNKLIALILLLLALITGVIVWLNWDNSEPVATPTPVVTSTPTPSPTPEPTVEPTPEPEPEPEVVKEFDITVDGVSYVTKEELTKAVNSPEWVEPQFECMLSGDNEGKYAYFTSEEGAKTIPEDKGFCLLFAHEPTDQQVGQMLNIEYQATDISGRYSYQLTNFPFDEFVVMNTNRNTNYEGGTEDYFYYSAMADWDSQRSDIKLFQAAGMDKPVYTVDDYVYWTSVIGGKMYNTTEATTIATPEQEAAYRAGWAYAEKIAIH